MSNSVGIAYPFSASCFSTHCWCAINSTPCILLWMTTQKVLNQKVQSYCTAREGGWRKLWEYPICAGMSCNGRKWWAAIPHQIWIPVVKYLQVSPEPVSQTITAMTIQWGVNYHELRNIPSFFNVLSLNLVPDNHTKKVIWHLCSISVPITVRKEYDLEKLCLGRYLSRAKNLWDGHHQHVEQGHWTWYEDVQRLQCMQQLLTSLASQLICLNLSQCICKFPEYEEHI